MVLFWCYRKWKYSVNICLFKGSYRKTRTRCEICSKLTIKTPKDVIDCVPSSRDWCRSGSFTVNFGHIWHPVLVFLLLTLNKEKYLWRKGLIKNFVFTCKFQWLSAVRLSIVIHSLVFCKFYLFCYYDKNKKERKQVMKKTSTSTFLSGQFLLR